MLDRTAPCLRKALVAFCAETSLECRTGSHSGCDVPSVDGYQDLASSIAHENGNVISTYTVDEMHDAYQIASRPAAC